MCKKGGYTRYGQKLHVNHEQLKNNLLFKIEEVRKRDKNKSKKLTLHEKLESDRKVFEECLYIDDSQAFDKLMNFTFNNVLNKLNNLNSELSRNELMCCCLLLLDLNSQEITLILGVQINTFYKLKQRLVQKLSLNSSSDIMPFLRNLWTS
jgi:DNA-binding CsgD family transcriptional regulator